MNVLFVTSLWWPESKGGASRMVTEEACRLRDRGHQVTVLTRRTSGRRGVEQGEDMAIYAYPTFSSWMPAFHLTEIFGGYWYTRNLLRNVRFDLVHVHLPLVGVGAVLACGNHVPLVSSSYSIWSLEWIQEKRFRKGSDSPNFAQRMFARYLLNLDTCVARRSQRILVLSQYSRELCLGHLGVSTRKVSVVPAGVDLDLFCPANKDLSWRERVAPRGEAILCTARRLAARHGVDQLLYAAGLLRDRGVRFRLIVAGSGPEEGIFRKIWEELDLKDCVSFPGWISEEELRRAMASCDLFVLPTVAYEGFGMVTAEAMASGVPVLGTPVGATSELLGAIDPRLITESAQSESLALGIERLLCEESLRLDLGKACRAWAEKNLAWETHMEGLSGVYRQALQEWTEKKGERGWR